MTGRRASVRSRAGIVLVLLLIATSLARPSAPSLAQDRDLAEQLDEAERRLEEARQRETALAGQVGTAQAQLAEADRRLVALESQLRAREEELADATSVYRDAESRAAAAAADLAEVTAELRESRDELAQDQERFDERVAAAYKYGGPLALTEAMFQADDFSELVQTGYYVRSVLQDDKSLIDRVTEQTRRITRARAEADAINDRLATEQAAAQRARAEVERATGVARELTVRVAEERQRRAGVLARLESDLASHAELVVAYEAESERIAQELAESRWRAGAPGAGELVWPTDGSVGSGYGYRTHPIFGTRRLHTGIDIGGPYGQEIVSAAEGLVVHAGWRGGYGLAVVIDHGGGVATLYAHQSRVTVSDGDVVTAGQQVGEIGSTGQSTGPHLHFEVRENGAPVDPMDYY